MKCYLIGIIVSLFCSSISAQVIHDMYYAPAWYETSPGVWMYEIDDNPCPKIDNEWDWPCLDMSMWNYEIDDRTWEDPNDIYFQINVTLTYTNVDDVTNPLSEPVMKLAIAGAIEAWNHLVSGGIFRYELSFEDAWDDDSADATNTISIVVTDNHSYFNNTDVPGRTFHAIADFADDAISTNKIIYQNGMFAYNEVLDFEEDWHNTAIYINNTDFLEWHHAFPVPASVEYPTADTQSVLTHELGHVLGLSHNSIDGSLMKQHVVRRDVDQPVRLGLGGLYYMDVHSAGTNE